MRALVETLGRHGATKQILLIIQTHAEACDAYSAQDDSSKEFLNRSKHRAVGRFYSIAVHGRCFSAALICT